FESKKKVSANEPSATVKISGYYPNANQIDLGAEHEPPRVEMVEHTGSREENLSEQLARPAQNTVEAPLENWRSKSLVESAKKYPAKVAESYHRKIDQIKLASGTVNQEISKGVQRVSDAISVADAKPVEPQSPDPEPLSEKSQFRAGEVSRYFDQAAEQDVQSQLSQLGKDLKQDLEQTQPTFEDVNQEMRRLQIDTVMERAKRELNQKNFEYAEFLAEQALEASYRGHVAFGLDEQSPQMLLQQIKSLKTPSQNPDVRPVEHSQPQVQTNSGQKVQNFQFQPSRVHPLKRRAVEKPNSPGTQKTQPRPSTGSSGELPLIVPRNMGIEPQTTIVQPRQSDAWSKKTPSGGIALEPPAFEEKTEEPLEIPFPEKTVQPKASSVPGPSLGLEELPDEPPARIKLSGPEPVQQKSVQAEPVPVQTEPVQKIEQPAAPAAPGPQLMLPKLPSVPGDLTSQTGQTQSQQATMLNHSGGKQGLQTAPVKFRSRLQEKRENGGVLDGENRNGPLAESSLTLDEIEWDLDEKRRPQLRSGWTGMSTLLLIVGGVIILLLLMIIVILLRRGNPSP
ncbi:MAG: hypothetical protein KDA77_05685, partial [Planctomycetaceae bacterium]|nr:hypothetical protein [Planctomycetaceae bacterium]